MRVAEKCGRRECIAARLQRETAKRNGEKLQKYPIPGCGWRAGPIPRGKKEDFSS